MADGLPEVQNLTTAIAQKIAHTSHAEKNPVRSSADSKIRTAQEWSNTLWQR